MPRKRIMTVGVEYTSFLLSIMFVSLTSTLANKKCHSRLGYHDPATFDLYSCAWCYDFLFSVNGKTLSASIHEPYLRETDQTIADYYLVPDITDNGNFSRICSTLTNDECKRWHACCMNAHDCCGRQLSAPPVTNGTCARTWDGWGCWDDTPPSTSVYLSCPAYISFSIPTIQAEKTCVSDGTWQIRDGQPWTNYQPCLNFHELKTSVYIGIACSASSISLLFPALIIFLKYNSLRKQCRIRLHIHFFLALLLKEIASVLWGVLVTYDKLSNDSVYTTTLAQNTHWCKVLSFCKMFMKCSTYSWMFCEGFYLHQLLSNAFSPPRSLICISVFGWGIPLLSASLYSLVRVIYSDESCWTIYFQYTEWIMYTPNLVFIVANLLFLCNIVRILLTQMQSHPNEPSNFRRAVKATFVLIPLFGVHLFVTIYRIPISKTGGMEYERFTICIDNLQGFFVALIFCFLNNEVNGKLRRTWRRQVSERFTSRNRRMTLTLNQTMSLRSDIEFKSPKISRKDEERTSIVNGDHKRSDNSVVDV
ncbi:calcitonin receptor-like [Mytilus edulis]|uniref:calcitonin receptor-like n=1 Tax=Mytilus edulis TaxID=6550 RepID=UPI0039F027DE